MGTAIVWLVNTIISLLVFMIIARAVISWLVAFDVLNTRNRFVSQVLYMLERITDPVLRPFQRLVPNLGGIDVSPIVAFLFLQVIRILFNIYLSDPLIAMLR